MIDIKFTPIPTSLIYTCDGNCLSLISLLINKESYWQSQDKLEDGYFFFTNEDIIKSTTIKKNTIIQTIEGLYRNGLIDVKSKGKSGNRQPNYFRINWNKIQKLDNQSFDFYLDESNKIKSVGRKEKLTYRIRLKEESVPALDNKEGLQNATLYELQNELDSVQNESEGLQNATLHNNINNNNNKNNNNIHKENKNNREKEKTYESEEYESEIIEYNDSEISDSNKQDNSDNNKSNNQSNNQISMDKKNKNSFEVISSNVITLCNKLNQINDLSELVEKAQLLANWLDNKSKFLSTYEINMIGDYCDKVYTDRYKELYLLKDVDKDVNKSIDSNPTKDTSIKDSIVTDNNSDLSEVINPIVSDNNSENYIHNVSEQSRNSSNNSEINTNNPTEVINSERDEKGTFSAISDTLSNQVIESISNSEKVSENEDISSKSLEEIEDELSNEDTSVNQAVLSQFETISGTLSNQVIDLSNSSEKVSEIKENKANTNSLSEESLIAGMKQDTFNRINSTYQELVSKGIKVSIRVLSKEAKTSKDNASKFLKYISGTPTQSVPVPVPDSVSVPVQSGNTESLNEKINDVYLELSMKRKYINILEIAYYAETNPESVINCLDGICDSKYYDDESKQLIKAINARDKGESINPENGVGFMIKLEQSLKEGFTTEKEFKENIERTNRIYPLFIPNYYKFKYNLPINR